MKSQIIYGYSIDEKCSVHKNRLGARIYLQTNKRDKYGISANYNYSKYKYPVNTTALNGYGTKYYLTEGYAPPYDGKLGTNIVSVINGYNIEGFTCIRLSTMKKSSLNLKIAIGYLHLIDTYSANFFGEKTQNTFTFNALLCNMYFTYLTWYKNIGIEPLLGAGFYKPFLPDSKRYLSNSPFVGTEIEIGVSIYFQKRSHQL